ncbi:complex I subunit 5 family protein [Thauera sp. WH-1]|uniref:complex I subunit 5 family protein n=1 Tax=Thauera sp. WH-1 TaxID=3398230 RepID=UPI0039FD6E4A
MDRAIDAFGLVLVPALPLAMMLAWCVPGWRCRIECWTPWAALPALLLALSGAQGVSVRLDAVLFGTVLALDDLSRVFLAFTALLWLGAGFYSRGTLAGDERASAFRLLWLATMAGNFGLILARDLASFYASFALMSFAAYGLVIHDRSRAALHAGRVYLTMAVIGEGLIIAGLLLAAGASPAPQAPLLADLPAAIAASPRRDLTIACLIAGFGIKAGLPLLHMWLPLAHPVAPVPASAVLSGAMIKAGLLGWLNTLPLGLLALPQWGGALITVGFAAAFGAAAIGIHQRKPKTVLAYSSISQMGLITVGVGAGLHQPALWPALAPAIALYALHHGLAKGALFLGVGIAPALAGLQGGRRRALWLALALPGLALAGPMVSGAAAKISLKSALAAGIVTPAWWQHLPLVLSLAAVGTTALIARYLWLLAHSVQEGADDHPHAAPVAAQWLGWGLVLGASVAGLILLPWVPVPAGFPPDPAYLPDLLWPVLVGGVLALWAARRVQAWPVPAGDVLGPLLELLRAGTERGGRIGAGLAGWGARYRPSAAQSAQVHTDAIAPPPANPLELALRRHAAALFALLAAVTLTLVLLGLGAAP